MEQNRFNLWNRITAALTFVISAFTYLATIEPSASFWDCGEFIASSYKLEVGHPPGNPVFQLIARFFTIFSDNLHAAVMVNAMSALCSALTIFFLYLTIVFFAKRLIAKGEDGRYTTGQALAIFGSGAVGALAYCFSDTFWFSAVEGEVYAMSSLFTALVFWAITRWYDQADERYANRWIVLIAFLMGLSIGVHLLNLLAIPAIVFMYYYRKREDQPYTLWESVKIMLVSVVIVGLLVFLLIPYLPKVAAYFDLFFVNTLGLPYNSGAAFFMLALLTACFWGLFRTLRSGKVFWNTALLCLTMIVVGFSIFSIVIIRSSVKTPTNEYQPDNAFTLVRYLSREQYGSTPLLYGQYFGAPYDIKTTKYWAPLDGKYKKVTGPADADYHADGKMFFPRMWSSSPDGRYEEFYLSYMNGKGRSVPGAEYRKPSFWNNNPLSGTICISSSISSWDGCTGATSCGTSWDGRMTSTPPLPTCFMATGKAASISSTTCAWATRATAPPSCRRIAERTTITSSRCSWASWACCSSSTATNAAAGSPSCCSL